MKKKIYLILFVLFGWLACTEEHPILNYPVDLSLDTQHSDKNIRRGNILGYRTYTIEDMRERPFAIRATGYGGVLAVRALDGECYAFDLACPHENDRGVLISVDQDRTTATCPKCKTVYDISAATVPGIPIKGVSKSQLKKYSVYENGSKIIIRNH